MKWWELAEGPVNNLSLPFSSEVKPEAASTFSRILLSFITFVAQTYPCLQDRETGKLQPRNLSSIGDNNPSIKTSGNKRIHVAKHPLGGFLDVQDKFQPKLVKNNQVIGEDKNTQSQKWLNLALRDKLKKKVFEEKLFLLQSHMNFIDVFAWKNSREISDINGMTLV